ncbi:MAG: SpoIIIAH-like family protein [Fusicatenibacter sp.]
MEKLEKGMDASEEFAEKAGSEGTAGKKKLFRKNQVIITALAIMIAAAGYINYADGALSKEKASTGAAEDGKTAVDADTILQDISSLDYDITDEVTADAADDSSNTDTVTETPGEAVLTGASTYMAEARIEREQVRSQNKETLNSIINNTNLSEEERQSAVQSMVEMTELVEKESAAELLLEAKGFSDVVVNLTGETADVVVAQTEISDEQRAQIEDIVTRKTGIGVENIVITPMSTADTGSEE